MMEDWGSLRQPSAEGGKADRPSRPMARPARSEAEGGSVRAQYRIHFADGTKVDVDAETPAQARATAVARHPGAVTKIKIVRGEERSAQRTESPRMGFPRDERPEPKARGRATDGTRITAEDCKALRTQIREAMRTEPPAGGDSVRAE